MPKPGCGAPIAGDAARGSEDPFAGGWEESAIGSPHNRERKMARRKRGSPLRRLVVDAVFAFGALGLIWSATAFGLHNKLGEKLMAPFAPKPATARR